jgi:hypothetical protein
MLCGGLHQPRDKDRRCALQRGGVRQGAGRCTVAGKVHAGCSPSRLHQMGVMGQTGGLQRIVGDQDHGAPLPAASAASDPASRRGWRRPAPRTARPCTTTARSSIKRAGQGHALPLPARQGGGAAGQRTRSSPTRDIRSQRAGGVRALPAQPRTQGDIVQHRGPRQQLIGLGHQG